MTPHTPTAPTLAPYAMTPAQRAKLTAWRYQLDDALTGGAFNSARLRQLVGEIAFTLRMDSEADTAIFLAHWQPCIDAELASVARFERLRDVNRAPYIERVSPAIYGSAVR